MSSETNNETATPQPAQRRGGRRGTDTRRRIEEAAARLFTRDGYGATTMQAVATEAGVHVQTIYLAYGTKAALLAACAARLVAGEEDPETHPSQRRWAREVTAAPDAGSKLSRYVSQISDVSPRVTPLLDVLRATAPAEPDVAAFLTHINSARREGSLQLLGYGAAPGTWRPELTPDQIADIVFAIASPDTIRALVDGCGWSRDATEALIVRVLEQELLPDREASGPR